MKECDRLFCPCCGEVMSSNGVPRTVTPDCRDLVHDETGALQCFGLYWMCQECGCTWRDGQRIEQEDGKEGGNPDPCCADCGSDLDAMGYCKDGCERSKAREGGEG